MAPATTDSPGRNTSPPRTARVGEILLAAIAVAAVWLGYGRSLDGYFVGDDFGFVARFTGTTWGEWTRLFVHNWKDGLWDDSHRELRPLNALAFMIDARLWGANATGFRVTNLLLHAGNAFLVGLLARRVSRSLAGGAAATTVFALHPVNAGAVAWISGRVDLLATFLYLAALLAFLRYRERPRTVELAGVTIGAAACLFTKEAGYTFPLAMLAVDLGWLRPAWSRRQRPTWLPYAGVATAIALYSVCRHLSFGTAGLGTVGEGMPDPSTRRFYAETFFRHVGYAVNLLPPLAFWFEDWIAGGRAFEVRHAVRLAAIVLGVIGAAFAVWRWRRHPAADPRATLVFTVAWYALTTGPLIVSYYSSRHLYPAVAGLAVGLAVIGRTWFATVRARAAAVAVLALYCGWHLPPMLRFWTDAAQQSRAIASEVAAVGRSAPPGSALMLDVPAFNGPAFCWSWALPHALRPPFTRERLDETLVVVGPMTTAAFQGPWRQQPAFGRLAEAGGECWLVRGANGGTTVERVRVPAERVRAAARQFAVDRSAPPMAWRRFVSALAP